MPRALINRKNRQTVSHIKFLRAPTWEPIFIDVVVRQGGLHCRTRQNPARAPSRTRNVREWPLRDLPLQPTLFRTRTYS